MMANPLWAISGVLLVLGLSVLDGVDPKIYWDTPTYLMCSFFAWTSLQSSRANMSPLQKMPKEAVVESLLRGFMLGGGIMTLMNGFHTAYFMHTIPDHTLASVSLLWIPSLTAIAVPYILLSLLYPKELATGRHNLKI
ncbi:MAG: hypothetical protein OXT67_05535 [Zetaproteobacteria bacterium]|nr:hypothetical protein [Zetaproteobacteria bacterium]